MHADLVGPRHIEEHAPEPIVGDICDEIGDIAEPGAGEGRRDCIPAEGDGIILRDRLVVAVRNGIAEQSYIDIGVADEQSLHASLPVRAKKTTQGGRKFTALMPCPR